MDGSSPNFPSTIGGYTTHEEIDQKGVKYLVLEEGGTSNYYFRIPLFMGFVVEELPTGKYVFRNKNEVRSPGHYGVSDEVTVTYDTREWSLKEYLEMTRRYGYKDFDGLTIGQVIEMIGGAFRPEGEILAAREKELSNSAARDALFTP